MQFIAHGSDSNLYFQWRKSRGSSEKFHGAVVDHDNDEQNRVFQDVAEVGKALEEIKEIKGLHKKPKWRSSMIGITIGRSMMRKVLVWRANATHKRCKSIIAIFGIMTSRLMSSRKTMTLTLTN